MFNFRVLPLDNVPLFSLDNDQHLDWFKLTYGCYWLNAGGTELFRYQDQVVATFGEDVYGCGPYVDYYVSRLWEDLLDILPSILAPIPQVLIEKLPASNLPAWRASVERWIEKHWLEVKDDGTGVWDTVYEEANIWLRERYLESWYLVGGPVIWFWNDGTYIHIEWDNRERKISDIPAWTSQIGSWVLPVEEFLEEVRAFDRSFIQAMQDRVEQIAAGWTRPNVHLDKDRLALEHADRSTWLEETLTKARQEQSKDWDAVIKAVALIESEIQP